MSEIMTCPSCQTTLRIREDMAGKNIKCPRCAHLVSIPARGAANEASPQDITTDLPAREARGAATRPCPACGEPIALTARQCRHCHAAVEDEDTEEQAAQRSKYKPCPRCAEVGARRVTWTAWGSFYGPALFTHVRCPGCGYKYNGRTGRSNLIPAIVFVTVPLVLIVAVLGFIGYIVYIRVINPP
jgi:predicted Zn finger-like uncharacterized protein